MRVLLTGADGYIGAVMGPYLMAAGHIVQGVDIGYYRGGWLYHDVRDRPAVVTKDIRDLTLDDVRGFDAVIHLAELSNDPLGAHNRDNTYDINLRGTLHLAYLARKAGVRRFVYASSCSVYGAGADSVRTEMSEVNPQTAYAECKVMAEEGLADITDETFVITCLRNATAFGASPRMRFDIVLNNLAGLAWTQGRIAMTSDGTPWRPLVHVLDICKAFALTLEAPEDRVRGQIFNVGADEQNYRVREIAEIVAAAFPGCTISFAEPGPDNRSYRVSFAKIRENLPGFACDWSAARGAAELRAVFAHVGMTRETFEAAAFTRLNALKSLVTTGQIDGGFHMRPPATVAASGRMEAAE